MSLALWYFTVDVSAWDMNWETNLKMKRSGRSAPPAPSQRHYRVLVVTLKVQYRSTVKVGLSGWSQQRRYSVQVGNYLCHNLTPCSQEHSISTDGRENFPGPASQSKPTSARCDNGPARRCPNTTCVHPSPQPAMAQPLISSCTSPMSHSHSMPGARLSINMADITLPPFPSPLPHVPRISKVTSSPRHLMVSALPRDTLLFIWAR